MTQTDITRRRSRGNGNGQLHTRPSARLEPLVVAENERFQITGITVASVARIAVPFWSFVGATALGVVLVFWGLLRGSGAVARFEHFVDSSTGLRHFHVMSVPIVLVVALFVALMVVIAIALTIVAAMVYNLLATLTGGIEVKFQRR
jgi:hypothetical protein